MNVFFRFPKKMNNYFPFSYRPSMLPYAYTHRLAPQVASQGFSQQRLRESLWQAQQWLQRPLIRPRIFSETKFGVALVNRVKPGPWVVYNVRESTNTITSFLKLGFTSKFEKQIKVWVLQPQKKSSFKESYTFDK